MVEVDVCRSTSAVVACMLPLSFAAAASPSAGPLPTLSTATMLDCSGLPCVDAITDQGKHLKLAVDTGNPTSFISIEVAKALGLPLIPYKTAAGKVIPNVQTTVVPELKIGSGSLSELKLGVVDFSPSVTNGTFPAVDGTIAYGAFKQRVLQLDYANHTLGYSGILEQAQPCPAASCGKIRLITFGHQGPPIVVSSGFVINGKQVNMQIDTMFTGTMLIFPTAVDRLGLQKQSASKTVRHFAYTDDGVDMLEAGSASEGFGDKTLLKSAHVYFAGPKVHLPDGLFDGTVGAELFAGHRLTMDFSGMNAWIE